jgi:hypothetical protein
MAKKQAGKKMAFKDRKTGLVIFGIIHMIIGTFCVLFMFFTIIGAIAVTTLGENAFSTMNSGQLILAGLLYLLLAVWFIWMGIGSILSRKWARVLILITSWLWFISGVLGFIFILLFMPDIFGPMATGEEITTEIAVVGQSILMGFMVVILVIIPGAFVLFYSSRHVKATCEQRDPRVRWTDKAPFSVITISSLLGVVAISMPFLGFYQWAVPFFGFFLSGIPGAVVVLIYTLLFAYAAWGIYKLQIMAWWCGFILTIVSAVSMGITFSRVSLLEFYEQMNMPRESIEIMKELGFFQDANLYVPLSWGLMIIGFLIFLMYTKRHFTAAP